MRAVLLGLAAAVGCGGSDDVSAALEEAANGRRELAGIRIEYREERPLRGSIGVVVLGDGTVVVTTERLRAGCEDPRSRTCWKDVERHTQLAPADHRELAAALARARLEGIPREDHVPPGKDRLAITIDADDARVGTSLAVDRADQLPDLAAARHALLALASE